MIPCLKTQQVSFHALDFQHSCLPSFSWLNLCTCAERKELHGDHEDSLLCKIFFCIYKVEKTKNNA